MSCRALRRLQGRGEVMVIPPANQESESEEEEEVTHQAINKFALLNNSSSSSEEEEEEQDVVPMATKKPEVLPSSSRKKGNRKKKRIIVQNPVNDNDNDDEELDKAIEELQNSNIKAQTSSQKTQQFSNKSVLTVEHRYLNPDNELRKIFGSRVLMSDPSYRRRNHGTTSKGVWLTQPQSNWAKLGRTGISMTLLETKNSCQYYKYEHSKEYQDIQFKFLDAVESSDHRNIATLIESHSYHVDSLVTFSDVYKIHDDTKMARELIERALYCLERSFHSCFNMATGTSRLPYKYQENRCLFLALYKHMNFVAQRGCNRTALELCKVLLSLDPEEDPLCSVFLFDYFALRSGEYKYLMKFYQEGGINRNLDQLPNWAYSIALARFQLSQSDEVPLEKSNEALQNALIMFPSVLMLLLEKCSIQPDSKVSSHSYFTSQARESTPQGLQLLCHLFVQRNHLLWKEPSVLSWLESNVKAVLERVDQEEKFVKECYEKRKSRYQKPPLNVYRHAMISELPDLSSLIPMEIRMGTLLSHDPLPPKNTIASYERQTRSRSGRSHHPVSLFFQSLLPGFDPNDAVDELVAGNAEELHGNAQTLMNAMRELIQRFQQPMRESDEEDFAQDWD